jgi:hypothetical protein
VFTVAAAVVAVVLHRQGSGVNFKVVDFFRYIHVELQRQIQRNGILEVKKGLPVSLCNVQITPTRSCTSTD